MSHTQRFCDELASIPGKALSVVSFGGLVILALALGLVTLFLVHQLSIWISLDPERAFHSAKGWLGAYATAWNTVANIWNGLVEVLLVAIPGWNAGVGYVLQPIVYTALDVLSIAFTGRDYDGILSEDTIPYEGFKCPLDGSLDKSSEWCGKVSFYANQLGTASGSTSNFISNSAVVLSTQTARRLSEMTGEPIVGALDLSFLMDALQALLGSAIVILGEVSDIFFHVAWTVLSEVFELIFELVIVLAKALSSLVMMVVRSGLLDTVLKFGLNLLVVVLMEVMIPFYMALINVFTCMVDYFQPAGWMVQLDCIDRTCFQEGSDVFGEVFHTFSSIPQAAKTVQRVVTRLFNPTTGQSYSSSSEGQADVPEVDAGSKETPRAHVCGECFNCKIPELRAVFMLIGTIYGCALDGERYTGRVEEACLMNGVGYLELCGPRGYTTDLLSDTEWRQTYTLHRRFNDKVLQNYASRFEQLSISQGGHGNIGNIAHRISSRWMNRDVGLGADQSAGFIREVCKEMRRQSPDDGGPEHTLYPKSEMKELVMGTMYEQCKYAKGIETCQVEFGQQMIDFSYEVSSCMKSQPQCMRQRQICLGRCNGEGGGALAQDFATTIVKQELSVAALGEDAIRRGRANCTIQNRVIEVPLFAVGDSFALYASRLSVRGGFTAIDVRACRREPLACAAIQRVLEKEPTLTYDVTTGRFRHAYSLTPPNPPPPPLPPPRLIQYNLKHPCAPPPPPSAPPPWYEGLEQCVPIVTGAEANIDSTQMQIDEERAVCLYVRALSDERVEASRCFETMSPFPPPPPPMPRTIASAIQTRLRRRRVRNGGTTGPLPESDPTNENSYVRQHVQQSVEVHNLLDRLSSENFQLRTVLEEIRPKLIDPTIQGRRLFERLQGTGTHKLSDSIKYSELSVGGGSLLGLTISQCSSLCAALQNETDSLHSCNGIAYRMQNPDNRASLQTAFCFLLRNTGGCTPMDFAASVFSRRDTSGCRNPTSQDNPLCVQLAPDRVDMRVLDYAAAKASCRQGKGSPRMPRPRSSLEAFSMISYNRERGGSSFWAEKPIPHAERQLTHWSGLDGQPFYYPGNFDKRCILVATQSDNAAGYMYARMEPCSGRLADSVVCESGSAAPPPPMGEAGVSKLPPPAPPPPPIATQASIRQFIKEEIRPRTEAICLAGLVDSDLAKLCNEFSNAISKPVSVGVIGSFLPQCNDICWHSCSSSSNVDVDSFERCRDAECADTLCRDFLLAECPTSTHAAISRLYSTTCNYVAPSPPSPPLHPPQPPQLPMPPRSPPPPTSNHGIVREASSEKESDPDCHPVTYSACVRAAEEMHRANPTISPNVELSQASCEGTEADVSSCFLGCALGNELGVPALFTFQRSSVAHQFEDFMSRRCVDNNDHPFCLCGTPNPPPPPFYDSVSILTKPYAYAGTPEKGSLSYQPSAFFKPVAVDSKLPDEFAHPVKHTITCRGSDSGAEACARSCARDLLGTLRAFHITANALPPSPPPPSPPPMPPRPPPSPSPPISEFRFHGALDTCRRNRIYLGTECRDGGVGSVFPPLCDYGSQVEFCGHRPDVGNNAAIGDNSCESARNGQCEDGGPGTVYFATDASGNNFAVCQYATDRDDCPARYATYGPLTYSNAAKPPLPPKPPPPPPPHSPPALPYYFTACENSCAYSGTTCSDGGMGAYLVNGVFQCNYGTQCNHCGPREDVNFLRANVPPHAMNGVCDDTVLYGLAGYGQDTRDCGVMPVQHLRGPPIAIEQRESRSRNRELQLSIYLYPSPKPPPPIPPPSPNESPSPLPPPPPPFPPIELGMCECSCYAESSDVDSAASDMDWDPMALTAMASSPSENTILYSAYTVIGRGGTIEVPGTVFLYGSDLNLDASHDSLVSMPSMSSKVAHISSGWKIATSSALSEAGMFSSTVVRSLAPSARDECATYCVRVATANGYRYELAYMQTEGPGQPCHCFKVESPRLPSDADATEWIKKHASPGHASSELYVLTPSRHAADYVPEIESTVHYSRMLGSEASWFTTNIPDQSQGWVISADTSACASNCASKFTTNLAAFSVDTTNFVWFDRNKYHACKCFVNDLLSILNQDLQGSHDPGNTDVYYHAQVCSHTHLDPTETSFVWNNEQKQWCPGVVPESGMGLSVINGTVYNAAGSEDYGEKCSTSCAGDCRFAELMITPWFDLQGTLPVDSPPPPSPPSPPPVPPPLPRPYNPLNGTASNHDMYRSWHPLSNEYPKDSDGDGLFEITCGLPSCNTQFPIFVGGIDQTFELAQQLDRDNTFHKTICPFECKPTVFSHALSPSEELSLKSGTGFGGFLFSGKESNDVDHDHYNHIPSFTSFTESHVHGATKLEHNFGVIGVEQFKCKQHMESRSVVGAAMGVWLATGFLPGGFVPIGDCVIFLATRSKQQHTLWKSFLAFARTVTSLPHYAPISDSAFSERTPDDSEPCGSQHDSCVYWNEFDSLASGTDDNSYFCRPANDLTNVLTPMKLLEMTQHYQIHFPPPSPPSPLPPSPPYPPPPPPMVCSAADIPTLRDGRTFPTVTGVSSTAQDQEWFTWYNPDVYCWKWSFDDFDRVQWPPRAMHNFEWESDLDACGNTKPTLSIKYDKIRMYNTHSTNLQNEVVYPTGGYYPMCSNAADNECCVANHQFQTCNNADVCGSENVYTNRHVTNCKLRCEYERRYGDDEACIPAHKSCQSVEDESYDPQKWFTARYMETYCICGAKLDSLGRNVMANWRSPPPSPPRYPGRRTLLEEQHEEIHSNATLQEVMHEIRKLESRSSDFDVGMGGRMNASYECITDTLNFKHRYIPDLYNGFQVCDYMNSQKPKTAQDTVDCTSASSYQCCSTDRHSQHMSKVYRNSGSGSFTEETILDIGTDVFDKETSSNLIAEDMNDDGFEDLIIGNKFFTPDFKGSFHNQEGLTIGSDTFRKAYSVDFDFESYKDIAYIDGSGKAYIMRSSNTYQPQSDASFEFNALYTIERKNDRYIRFNCVPKSSTTDDADDTNNECENLYEGMPLIIKNGVDASTTCSISYLQNLNDLRVRSYFKYECTWTSTQFGSENRRHTHCYSFIVAIPIYDTLNLDTCPGTANDYNDYSSFKTIVFQGVKQPQGGQIPTYHYPQRIGDVDDVDVVDIAIAPVYVTDSFEDFVMDACLLMRGRGVKCFEFPSTSLLRYDSGTAKTVFKPLPDTETLDDAIGFSDIRGASKMTTIQCDHADSRLESETLFCITSSPHGLGITSRVRIKTLEGYGRIQCQSSTVELDDRTPCDWRWGSHEELTWSGSNAFTTLHIHRASRISLQLPFRFLGPRNGDPIRIELQVESKPHVLKAGIIETGRISDYSSQMIILRSNNYPMIVQARNNGASKNQYGVSLNDSPSMASYALGRVALGGHRVFPLFAVADSSGYNQLWYTLANAAQETPTESRPLLEFDEPATIVTFCNLNTLKEATQVEVQMIMAGPGRKTNIYTFNSPDLFPSGHILKEPPTALEPKGDSFTFADIVAVACADVDGDGDEDIITHSVVEGGGSCAYRCHEIGRFGFEEKYIGESELLDNVNTKCYCGPLLDIAVDSYTPQRPPVQPSSSPPPPMPPPPPVPPTPGSPPPPPTKHRSGLCVHFRTASLKSPSPPPPPDSIDRLPLPPAPPPAPPSPHSPSAPSPPPPSPPPLPPRNPPPPPPPKPPPSLPAPPNSPPPAPAFPPIEDTLNSRLIYFSLSDENARVMQEHAATGWQPLSLAILDSEQGYPDSALIEGVWMQSKDCHERASPYNTSESRSLVTIGQLAVGHPDCVHAAPDDTREMFYRNRACIGNREPMEEYKQERPLEFQAKCIVILIEESSRKALLDMLVAAGRKLHQPLRISVNYTTALSPDPDLEVSSMSCAVGEIIHENYRRDTVGQELQQQLIDLREQLEVKERQVTLFDRTLRGLSAYRPPNPPPPPSPPPRPDAPPGMLAPPIAPQVVSVDERLLQLRREEASLNYAINAKLTEIGGPCVKSATNTCGRTHDAAPDPWVAADGQRCAGYETREAFEGSFCAHWGSPNNVAAAENAEAEELLSSAPPWCYNEAGVVTACSPVADRVIRSGTYEIEEWLRPDRYYCQSRLFRDLVLQDGSAGEAACRANLTARNSSCHLEVCDQCTSQCTYPTAKAVAGVLRCTVAREQLAFVHCLQTSDAGQLARASHGAIRGENYIAVPEKLAAHAYKVCHWNPGGYVQRDSVSCRKEHRNSPMGRFKPGFDEKSGNPRARDGFIVTCKRNSDCYSRCPAHPLTGDRYQCQTRYKLYDVPVTGNDGEIELIDLERGSGKVFDPDPVEQAITGEWGICVDVDSSFNQGCPDQTMSAVMDGVIGCMDRQVSSFLCGLEVDIMDGDSSTAAMKGSFFYIPPRVLVAAGEDLDGDGQATPAITCTDPLDCNQKCRWLERTSLHGAGAPPACALCDQYCSNNIVSTITSLVDAIWADVLTVVRLLSVCFGKFGLGGCVCQMAMTLQPLWRKVAKPIGGRNDPNYISARAIRCENGDPFVLLMQRIADMIADNGQNFINQKLVDPANDAIESIQIPGLEQLKDAVGGAGDFFEGAGNAIGSFFGRRLYHDTQASNPNSILGRPIPRVCFPVGYNPRKCDHGYMTSQQAAQLAQCENSQYGLEEMCYFARVKEICTHDDSLNEYTELFAQGYKAVDEVEAEFAEAFGESFRYLDPATAELMRQVEISSFSGPDLTSRRDICVGESFRSAMSLDMIIQSCMFAVMETFCPKDAEPDESFEFFIDTVEFELPRVRFEFDVSPPPPPPFNLDVYEELVAMDPHGFQMVRSQLEDLFPRLSDVATSSMGATVGNYIADFEVTPAQITKAFLASKGMTRDGLGARVIESKHTGRWRPACMEMFTLFDDKYKASAGSTSAAANAAEGNPHFNDVAYDSQFDRNLLVYAMLEIKLSLDKDSLSELPYSTLGLYDTICGSGVGGHRVPTHPGYHPTYRFRQGYEIDKFAPVVMYGSLESVRSAHMATINQCSNSFAPEDVAHHVYCNMADRSGSRYTYLRLDNQQRSYFAPFKLQRDRLCNPSWQISIEDTLARPPRFANALFDTPVKHPAFINAWIVPVWARGEERITVRTMQLSLRSFVYITSSADSSVRPGMHRLLDLPVFGNRKCGELPGANCAPPGFYIPINTGPSALLEYENNVQHTRGRLMMRTIRCSQLIQEITGQTCHQQPYAFSGDSCYKGNLDLLRRPTFYSSRQWVRSLVAPPPSPPPYSPSPPPPNPLPPVPNPPPSPPYVQSQGELMASIRTFEEQACTSVYYLTTTTRCERLAVALTRSVLYNTYDPPYLPPAQPLTSSPPPPSPPPSPSFPEGISTTPISSTVLSTMRIPTLNSGRRLNLYDDGYYVSSSDLDGIRIALSEIDPGAVVRCTYWHQSAPLPCVSGALASNCLSGTRHCGTDFENSDNPSLQLIFSGSPALRGNRLWGVEISLPQNEELADLFYRSAESVGGSGYEVTIFKSDGSQVPCQPQSSQVDASGLTLDRKVQHVCAAGGATDAELYALSDAIRMEITLTGQYRQLWLRSVTVIEISLASAQLPPRPPHPPPIPQLPPVPPKQPSQTCAFSVHKFYTSKTTIFKEPCGLTSQQCCNFAHEYGAGVDGYELDDAGCCLLVKSGGAALRGNTTRWGYLSTRAGTGAI